MRLHALQEPFLSASPPCHAARFPAWLATYDPKAKVAQQFGNPVHCVKIADDGLVCVCDRTQNRIQVFKKDCTFVKEWFFEKNTLGNGAVWDLALWPDPKQTYLLNADGETNEIRIIRNGPAVVS